MSFHDYAEPSRHYINDLFSYALELIDTILENQSSQHLHHDDWHRTIYIDTLGVKTIEFGLSEAKKKAFVQSGRK